MSTSGGCSGCMPQIVEDPGHRISTSNGTGLPAEFIGDLEGQALRNARPCAAHASLSASGGSCRACSFSLRVRLPRGSGLWEVEPP